jgi:hypothetical protein
MAGSIIAATSHRFSYKQDAFVSLTIICFPFPQMATVDGTVDATVDGTSSIFAATVHGNDVISIVSQQQNGETAAAIEAPTIAIVSVRPIEVSCEVHAPSASLEPSQVFSIVNFFA